MRRIVALGVVLGGLVALGGCSSPRPAGYTRVLERNVYLVPHDCVLQR
jgi:hypothetical protein